MTLFQVGINKISVNFDLLHYLFRFEQKNSNICYSAKQILIHNIQKFGYLICAHP